VNIFLSWLPKAITLIDNLALSMNLFEKGSLFQYYAFVCCHGI
jgi:hypothetical protein